MVVGSWGFGSVVGSGLACGWMIRRGLVWCRDSDIAYIGARGREGAGKGEGDSRGCVGDDDSCLWWWMME